MLVVAGEHCISHGGSVQQKNRIFEGWWLSDKFQTDNGAIEPQSGRY
jgi:hypothetical protein